MSRFFLSAIAASHLAFLALAPVVAVPSVGAAKAPALALDPVPAQLPAVSIGVVLDGPWIRNEAITELFQSEVEALNGRDYEIRFPRQLVGDWTVAGVRDNLDALLADPDIDIVFAMGVLVSNEAIQRTSLAKPVIAPFVINYEYQGAPVVPLEGNRLASGVDNLSYLTTPWGADRDLEEFYRIAPFTKVGVFIDGRLLEISGALSENIRGVAERYDVAVQMIPVTDSAREGLDAIEPDVDAVLVGVLLNMPDPEIDALIRGVNEKGLRSMALFGREQVERGLLLGIAPDTNFTRVARRVAIHTQSILAGEPAAELPIRVAQPRELVMNMATAREIGFAPDWSVMTEAELINEVDPSEPMLTLSESIDQAIAANLDYLASGRAVAAGEQAVREARAPLLPAIDAGLAGVTIDGARAESSFGQQPQHALNGGISFTQVVIADAASAGYRIQQLLQEAAVLDREVLRLDTVEAASLSYLSVLVASTLEEIQKRNVDVSRTNLTLAEARQAVGVASRAEVFRWQSEIASDRSDVLDAIVDRNLAEIELNRIRSRPLEENFRTDPQIADSGYRTALDDLTPFINDQISFRAFREFMVQEGLRDAPELRALDAGIAAQQRALTATQRNFWLPDVFAIGDLSHVVARGEASSGAPVPLFGEPPDTTWSLALQAAYPVFRGGARYAERERAHEELELLRLQKRATTERIEQRIRTGLHRMVGAYAQIDLAEQAATAARSNLDLVQDSYSQGVLSVIDLIDAQNAALTADLAQATAVYQFLIELTRVARAISSVEFAHPTDPAQRQAWIQRVEEYFRAARQP